MNITAELLRATTGCTAERAELFAPHIDEACRLFRITTPKRLAAFLAQIGHESGSLRYVREVWGPTAAQQRYEGRVDLGNGQEGDGKRFMGRGLIQCTGRFNYAAMRDGLRRIVPDFVPDFVAEPERLEDPRWAALSAGYYWHMHGLNVLADAEDFVGVTKRINGGVNGLEDRKARWKRAQRALAGEPAPNPEEPPMVPFIAAALPSLIQAAPGLIRIFGSSPQAEKNAQAAEVVAQIAKEVTGEPTVEGATVAIQNDPEVAAAFRDKVHMSLDSLLTLAERVNAMDQGNIAAARVYNTAEPLVVDTRWLKLRFIHILSLLFVGFAGAFVVQTWGTLTPELRGAVITLMVIAGWNGVRDYWMGSSEGSARKTDELARRAGQ